MKRLSAGLALMYTSISKRNVDFAGKPGSLLACRGRRRLHSVKAICVAVLLLSLPAVMSALLIAIREYPVPIADSRPGEITAGTNGALSFTENNGDKIGRITTAGVITEYPTPTAYTGLSGTTAVKWSDVPLSFEPNTGQAPAQVRYLTRGNSYTLYLAGGEAVLARPNQAPLRTKLLGANLSARIVGEGQQTSTSNYFIGNDPNKWRTSIPNYARVRYVDLYRGIDLVYYGRDGNVEYDWIVSPGADPQKIRLIFADADQVRIDRQGDLVITQGESEYRHKKPAVYQEIAGKRIRVRGTWVLQGKEAGFRVGTYDRAQTLVIDPPLIYATYLGGSGLDYAYAVAVDNVGNTYLTGETGSTNFPTSAPLQNSLRGVTDVFVTKINATGSAKLYSTFLGGGGPDTGYGIAVDSTGNAYVTGSTGSFDFPMAGAIQGTWGGSGDVFLTKINASGSALVYSTYLGGSSIDYATAIALDPSGSAYITGITFSNNFPTVNPFQAVKGAQQDAFVAKINASGTAWVYSTYLGGNNVDQGFGIAADTNGNAYVTGYTASTDFPLQSPYRSSNLSTVDAFVTKLNPAGSALVYSTYLGGSGTDYGTAIAVDSSGSAYVTGIVGSHDFPTVNAMQPHNGGGTGTDDSFVSKFDPSGSTLIYSTYLGGGSVDDAYAVAVDQVGRAYITGRTNSSDFPLTNPLQVTRTAFDMFITVLNPAGSARLFSTFLGGSGEEEGYGIAIDRRGNIHIAGATTSTDFPVPNAIQVANGGATDALVLSLGNSPWPAPIKDVFVQFPDGSMGIWYVGRTGRDLFITGSASLAGPSSGTTLVDVAHLNGGGTPDLILRFSDGSIGVWYMEGTTITGSAFISGPVSWRPAAMADLNNDGHIDMLLQNTDGSIGVWYLGGARGNQIQGFAAISGPISGWKLVGAADLNDDDHPDAIIQYTDGSIGVWYLGGAMGNQIQEFALMGSSPFPSQWSVVGVTDVDGDGHPDLVIRYTDGTLAVLFLGGAKGNQITGYSAIAPGNTNWKELTAH